VNKIARGFRGRDGRAGGGREVVVAASWQKEQRGNLIRSVSRILPHRITRHVICRRNWLVRPPDKIHWHSALSLSLSLSLSLPLSRSIFLPLVSPPFLLNGGQYS
jgi:hypothetical protein